MLQRVFQINRGLAGKIQYNCFFSKPFTALNPSKHIYMSHNFQNTFIKTKVYDEPIPHGAFPVYDVAAKEDSREYQDLIQSITLQHLKDVYPNNSLVVDVHFNNDQLHREWSHLGVADFHAEKEAILHKLSKGFITKNRFYKQIGIVVKQSKLTWVKEQRNRLEESIFNLQAIKFEQPFMFYQNYNTLVWQLVRQSHLWQAPGILGENGPLFKKSMEDLQPRQGIRSLQLPNKENKTLINRFVSMVHA